MKPDLKACGQALITAIINALLALALMLLIEFAISGSFEIAEAYVWAVTLIGLVIFFAQFWRQRHLCRNCGSVNRDVNGSIDQDRGNKAGWWKARTDRWRQVREWGVTGERPQQK